MEFDDGESSLQIDVDGDSDGECISQPKEEFASQSKETESAPQQMEVTSGSQRIEPELARHTSFKCDICDKEFTKKQNMMRHKVAHSDIREFHCRDCDAKFHRKDQLQDHSFMHFQSEELDCPVVNCTFITLTPSQLRSHMIEKHGVSLKTPASCKHCFKLFRSCRSLMIHYHAKEPFPKKQKDIAPTHYPEGGEVVPQSFLAYIQHCCNLGILTNGGTLNGMNSGQLEGAQGGADMHHSYNPDSVKSEIPSEPQMERSTTEVQYRIGGTSKTKKLTGLQEESDSGDEGAVETADDLDETIGSVVSNVYTDQLKSIFAEHSYSVANHGMPTSMKSPEVLDNGAHSGCRESISAEFESAASKSANIEYPQVGRCESVKSGDSIPLGGSATPVIEKDKLECPLCEITYHDAAMYLMHMGFHTLGDPFRCNMCGLNSKNRYEFNGHLMYGNHNAR